MKTATTETPDYVVRDRPAAILPLAGVGLALAGVLTLAGGALHPQFGDEDEFDAALSSVLADSAWVPSHALLLAGLGLLTMSLWSLRAEVRLRPAVLFASAASGLATIAMVPHLLASSEADEVLAGDSTPLTDTHTIIDLVSVPALGIALIALAVTGLRTRLLAGRILTAMAAIGSVAFSLAAPLLFAFEEPALALLFIGSVGFSAWMIGSGIKLARSSQAPQ